MTDTPILGLTMMSASQAQKEVVFNNFLIAMDALFKGSVLDATLTAPPASPAAGNAYIVGASPTGAWSGKAGKVTFYYNGWQFVNPSLKMRLYSAAQDVFYVYQSDNTWHAEPASTVSVLSDLTNVAGSPSDGYVLTYVGADSKWEPKPAVFTATLRSLTDVNVTEGAGIDGKALVWNNTAGKWAAATVLTTVPGFLSLADVVTTGVSGGFVPVYGATVGPGGTPGVHFINPATLITVSALSQVGDVAYPTGGAGSIPSGAYLQWNGGAWVPSTSAVSVSVESLSNGPGALSGKHGQIIRVNSVESALEYVPNTLANLSDVTVSEGPSIDGYVLAWNNAAGCWQPIAHASNSLSALTDVTVTEGSGIDGWVLAWKNSDTKWEAKPLSVVAVSGAYSDLTGKPALFSGAYADLTGKPTIPTNGSFALAALSDVSMTTGSGVDGYVVYWDNGTGKFKLKAAASGGGGGTLAGDTDVVITSPTSGQVLAYDGPSGKWKNQAQAGGGFTVGTPPVVVQFGNVTVNNTVPSVTLGRAPVSGNLLVAVVYTDGNQPTAASGWTQQAISTTGLWYAMIFTKVAGASEPTSQSPVTGGSSSHWTIGIWEVSGANATTPVLAIQSNYNNPSLIASTPTIPQTPSTLFLASLCASSSQTYSITRVFGIANVDANLAGGAGAQAAFGHCDSNNPVYGMLGSLSANAAYNVIFALISV